MIGYLCHDEPHPDEKSDRLAHLDHGIPDLEANLPIERNESGLHRSQASHKEARGI